jgi:hypothetical protein
MAKKPRAHAKQVDCPEEEKKKKNIDYIFGKIFISGFIRKSLILYTYLHVDCTVHLGKPCNRWNFRMRMCPLGTWPPRRSHCTTAQPRNHWQPMFGLNRTQIHLGTVEALCYRADTDVRRRRDRSLQTDVLHCRKIRPGREAERRGLFVGTRSQMDMVLAPSSTRGSTSRLGKQSWS